jgi:hypothetical protein
MLCARDCEGTPEIRLRFRGIAPLYEPWHIWHLAMAYAELGQPDDVSALH